MQEMNEQDYRSKATARSGGVFISYRALSIIGVTLVLIIGAVIFSIQGKGGMSKECVKVYQTEVVGMNYPEVKRQYITQGWTLETDEFYDAGKRRIVFSRCK